MSEIGINDIVFNLRVPPKVEPLFVEKPVYEFGRMYAIRTTIRFVRTSTCYMAYTGKYGNKPIRYAPTANKLYNLMKSYIDATKSTNKDKVVAEMREIFIKEDPNISEELIENADMRRIRLSLECYFRKNPSKTSLKVLGFTIERD